ncbi:MAG: hypothetical protein B7Z55_01790 [Planctomycetales bacterium 12-60-4]|nr:MAG: hypothetical protein B7Z55_01790 [Planctomycetales bacterium 12-60-4]
MNCTELEQEWLTRELQATTSDHARAWSQEAEQHFAECLACQQLRAADSALNKAISLWCAQPMALPSTERICAAIWNDRQKSPLRDGRVFKSPADRAAASKGQVRYASLTIVVAASVLCLVGLGLRGTSDRAGEEAFDQSAPSVVQAAPEASPAPVTATMALLWHDVRTSSAAAARSTVASLDRLPAVPLTSVLNDAVSSESQPTATVRTTADADRPWPGWGSPLGTQVGSAFRFLGDALPNEVPPAS